MQIKLSNMQQKIVDFNEGCILVKAGPGSGKTRVIIERIKRLLRKEKRVEILALTFSNMAADEMKSRIEEDESIIDCVNNVTVGTIHSFCLDLIQTRANLIGIESDLVIFENNDDRLKILRDIFLSNDYLARELKQQGNPKKYLNNILQYISDKKKKFITPTKCDGEEQIQKIYSEYNQSLLSQNAIDFDDILFYAYRILSENPSVSKLYNNIYKYYFVDEAQDLNYAQYMVIKALCNQEKNNIMMVGDENQSIYAFNGSNSDLMCKTFVDDYHPTIFELKLNFRCSKAIIRFANKLENANGVTKYFYEGEVSSYSFGNEILEAEFVSSKIKQIIKNGHDKIEHSIDFKNIAIIARNRYSLDKIMERFEIEKIPNFLKNSNSGIILDSELLNIFDLCLRLVINNKDVIHLSELFELLNLEIHDNSFPDCLRKSDRYKFLYDIVIKLRTEFQFDKSLDEIWKCVGSLCIFDEEEKTKIFNDIELYRCHWNKYTEQVPRENRDLASFRSYIALGRTQKDLSQNGVSLLTAHMSKGLQFEVVFVVGLCEGVFPDYRAIKNGGRELEQEKNNMFVAVTRAKRVCYLTYPRVKMMPWGSEKCQYPSRYIKDEKIIKK